MAQARMDHSSQIYGGQAEQMVSMVAHSAHSGHDAKSDNTATHSKAHCLLHLYSVVVETVHHPLTFAWKITYLGTLEPRGLRAQAQP
jgi:hypothetical protein